MGNGYVLYTLNIVIYQFVYNFGYEIENWNESKLFDLSGRHHKDEHDMTCTHKSRTGYLKNAQNDPIMMGANKLGISEAEK